ncbi:MAG TPA: exodeoxyribonuclease V subunit alpha [Propionibacteriaceae bacterium]|nr:exodeoxyribonuclease V subunit alpha [Propionibacteriaceae bacterium]
MSETATLVPVGDERGRLVHDRQGLLGEFNEAGVLVAADVHTALAIGRMGQESDERVLLALALAVRALRNGSVALDLKTVDHTVFDEAEEGVDLSVLPWPEPTAWLEACTASPLVTAAATGPAARPLRLTAGLLYLERYWQQEERVRICLQDRLAADPPVVDAVRLAAGLDRLFPPIGDGQPDAQRLAATVSAFSWLTVLSGGPGTGKTTTVARLLALLLDQPGRPVRIGLAAPTGKAAARLEEAVRRAAAELPIADRERLGDLRAVTLHRLLGWLPQARGRFRHDAHNQLPHDVVVVDETSMVSLTLMARLVEAVRPTARLLLVGDPDQLSSVEAGAVLADVVRAPGQPDPRLSARLAEVGATGPGLPEPVHGVVQLSRSWRFGQAIDALARAIRSGDDDGVMAVLRADSFEVRFLEVDPEVETGPSADALRGLAGYVRASGAATLAAARAGDVPGALAALDQHRLLCGHRRGPYGVGRWSIEVEHWLAEAVPGYAEDGEWYLGRPLLVTANDYEMGLYNGDTGVVVDTPAGVRAAFARGAEATLFAPVRLDAVQTVHAMTVHRAQGSQFQRVTFLVPPPMSPLLTRELLYTAVTRAKEQVQVIGSEAAIRRAVQRPASRASGLRNRLG